MSNNQEQTNFMSILLSIFTAVVCVMVLFALAASSSTLAQAIAFVLGLAAFLFFISLATYQLSRQNTNEHEGA